MAIHDIIMIDLAEPRRYGPTTLSPAPWTLMKMITRDTVNQSVKFPFFEIRENPRRAIQFSE